MAGHCWSRCGLGLVLALVTGSAASAQEQLKQPPAPLKITTLDLKQCIENALERQPRLAAARASQAAAEDASRAVDALCIPPLVVPELPIRRKQAGLGASAASANLEQEERDVIYAVTRTYFTVLFAREQERLARSTVDRLSAIYDAGQNLVKAGDRKTTAAEVEKTLVYVRLAETKRTQAIQGVKRAMAALREAVGMGPEWCFEIPPGPLPQIKDVRFSLCDIVSSALSRRGEIIRADLFADIASLEIEAQGTGIHKRMDTFAAGGDIHATNVNPGHHNGEYRPGAIPPEMPVQLAGARGDRMRRAQSLYARAVAVVDVVKNLIALEAEDAFLRWEEATMEIPQARDAAETAEKVAEGLTKDFTAKIGTLEGVTTARILAAQARSQYHEAVLKQILALADLERITAGALCAGFTELRPVRAQVLPVKASRVEPPQ